MSRETAGQKRKTSREDSDTEHDVESTREAKRPRISEEEIHDLLEEADDVLSEIENPQEWVRQFKQKGGE